LPINITLVTNQKDKNPTSAHFPSWSEFAAWFTHVQATPLLKDQLPGWIPATFTKPERNDQSVEAITIAVFDFDENPDPIKLGEILQGYAWCCADTYSSTPEKLKLRVAIQLSEPVPRDDWARVWQHLADLLKPAGAPDAKCRNPSRFYYQPFAPVASTGHAAHGKPFDWRATQTKPETDLNSKRQESAEKRLELACKRIKKAELGERNATLNKEAWAIGRRAHILGLERCRKALLKACVEADSILPSTEAERTVDRALEQGQENPLHQEQDWHRYLIWNETGTGVKTCYANVQAAIRHHPETQNLFALDERRREIKLNAPPPWEREEDPTYPRTWHEHDNNDVVDWLSRLAPQIAASPDQVYHEVAAQGAKNSFDSFERWLSALVWDGVERLDRVMIDLCGANETPLNRVFFRKWLISAVARTYEPGCQADYMLVLIGDQGLRKSKFLSAIVPDPIYHREGLPKSGDKDSLIALQGPVIVEDPDMSWFGAREISAIKAYITVRSDSYRAPYARIDEQHPRKCVFAGSSNEQEFLHDATGGRRFWPIEIHTRISAEVIEECEQVRAQWWSEAVARYRRGEMWYLTDEEEVIAREIQEDHRESDTIEEMLARRLAQPVSPNAIAGIESSQIVDGVLQWASPSQIVYLLGMPVQDRGLQMRVSAALRALNWRKIGKRSIAGTQIRAYKNPKATQPL